MSFSIKRLNDSSIGLIETEERAVKMGKEEHGAVSNVAHLVLVLIVDIDLMPSE